MFLWVCLIHEVPQHGLLSVPYRCAVIVCIVILYPVGLLYQSLVNDREDSIEVILSELPHKLIPTPPLPKGGGFG